MSAARLAPVRVLIVDDDASSFEDFKRAFKSTVMPQLEFDIANSTQQLEEMLRKKKYDVVSIDWDFRNKRPGDGAYGPRFFDEIRSKYSDLKVGVFSSDVSQLTSFRNEVNGADFILPRRPEIFDEYIETLREISRNRFQSISDPEREPEPDLVLQVRNTLAVVNYRLTGIFRENPELLRTIDPFLFETVVAELFEEDGYEVVLTPKRADGGKDIYVTKTDPLTRSRFLVECKRYIPPHKVDVGVARQLYGVVQQERASGGIIVTTSYFTQPAKLFAETVPYHLFLRDFDDIAQWLKKHRLEP